MSVIIDSAMSVAEALADHPERPAPDSIRQRLQLLTLKHWSYDGKVHQGQIVVHEMIARQVESVFAIMYGEGIPITKIVPIVAYQWDDELSMLDNNCSGYNFRMIAGKSTLSLHALGLAIDVDPFLNPYIKDRLVQPVGARYDPEVPGTLTANSRVVEMFKAHGFFWGGDWLQTRGCVDYQHFDVNPYQNSEQIIAELRQKGVILF